MTTSLNAWGQKSHAVVSTQPLPERMRIAKTLLFGCFKINLRQKEQGNPARCYARQHLYSDRRCDKDRMSRYRTTAYAEMYNILHKNPHFV